MLMGLLGLSFLEAGIQVGVCVCVCVCIIHSARRSFHFLFPPSTLFAMVLRLNQFPDALLTVLLSFWTGKLRQGAVFRSVRGEEGVIDGLAWGMETWVTPRLAGWFVVNLCTGQRTSRGQRNKLLHEEKGRRRREEKQDKPICAAIHACRCPT